MDEINSVKLLKSHMPVMNRYNGPEVFLAKQMIGMTCRLEGPTRNWMRGCNRYERPADFEVQIKRVPLKQPVDDLMVYSFTAVRAE